MPYHSTVDKIKNLLDQNSCWYETFEHEPVRTSEEASKIRTGYVISQGAKAIIVKAKEFGCEKKFMMFVLPGDKKFDDKKVKEIFNINISRFATPEEVGEITGGILPGGVPPFGNLFGLDVFVDNGLMENEKIVFNAGDKSFSIGMKSKDYLELVKPKLGNFT